MFATLLALSLAAPADPPKELPAAAKEELKTLQGKWRVVRFRHSDRETTPGAGDDGVIVEFKGHAIDFDGSGTAQVVELDPATDPRCLDFKVLKGTGGLKDGRTYESIYKLDGDTLTWAIHGGRERSRPTTFDKPTEADRVVIVLERVKSEPE